MPRLPNYREETVEHFIVPWLELDNGFFFTLDREMHDKFCDLFEVKH